MSASAPIADPLLRRAFGQRARPSDPHRTARVRIGSSRLRAPVSQRGSAISQRTVMNNVGYRPVAIPCSLCHTAPCLGNRQSGPLAIRPDRSVSSPICCARMRSGSSWTSERFHAHDTIRNSIRTRLAVSLERSRSPVSPHAGAWGSSKSSEGFDQQRMAQRQFSRVRRLYADGRIS